MTIAAIGNRQSTIGNPITHPLPRGGIDFIPRRQGLSSAWKSGIIVSMQCNPELVRELFFDPKHVGEVTEPNFVGRSASFKCGATLRISLHIDDSQRIIAAKFKAAGCSVLVASASLLIDQVLNKTTAEAAALGQQTATITSQLGALPAERSECPTLAGEALIAAIREYSNSARDEWHGDEALICTCFCVSERTIEREIETHQLQTIAEVTQACSAGGGCRSCYPLIEDILDDHWRTAGTIIGSKHNLT